MDGLSKSLVLWRNTGGGSNTDTAEGYPPAKCMNFKVKALRGCKISLTWKDPDDISVFGETGIVSWDKTVIVRKTGSYPTNERDGTIVVTSTVKNQYQQTSYIDSGLTDGVTYYYAAFTCSTNGIYNEESVCSYATAVAYRTMTVNITIAKTPDYGTYSDSAINMPYGKSDDAVFAWQEFFGYKPCLFKDGKVVGYLNPNDYTKFEDGTDADIKSGDAGDVMVEFPRLGINITKSGTSLSVSMTDEPNKSGYSYNAHNRGSVQKDYFYIGAYLGYKQYKNSNYKLRSLSGWDPTTSVLLSECRTYAGNLGSGYMNVGFYQHLFIQCMYLLQFKGHLNSQTVLGMGYAWNKSSGIASSGKTNTNGLMYGTDSYSSYYKDHAKLFGIEDYWGNASWFIDGLYRNDSHHILTTTDADEFGNIPGGYTDYGNCAPNCMNTSAKNVLGTNELGFIASEYSAYDIGTSYFTDEIQLTENYFYVGGSYYDQPTHIGIFYMKTLSSAEVTSDVCGRLCYL